MLISLNEIKKLVEIPSEITTDELIRLIDSRLVEVEGSVDWSERYKGIYIVKVVSAEDIPGTHLHLCKIDAGAAGKPFAEDYAAKHPDEKLTTDESLVQIVCGAPNVHAGMLAVWIQPGAIVPSTFDDEKFELSVRPLRGYDSYGMLAGADELGLDTEHKFIAEIDPKTQVADGIGTAGSGSFRNVKPGDSFAEVFDLNDVILDIENKSLTHRPDTFGLIGFAREVAGILGLKFVEPTCDFGLEKGFKKTAANLAPISIKITDPALCPRYSAAVFEVESANLESATEATKYLTEDAVFLAKAGMRAISKIVDATNIVMLKTGQPLHAFDYDKFVTVGGDKSAKILVRAANTGEKLTLLDGKEIDLNENDIVITSNNIPVALAGAMGGQNTEIDAGTRRVILESATFSLYNERKMQMAHGIFSEAITRFTKGQPASGTIPALERCAALLLTSPAEVADFEDEFPSPDKPAAISVSAHDINSLLGTDYDFAKIQSTLENVGFTVETVTKAETATKTAVETANESLKVTAPAWRTDIHIKEDIIEEVGRLNGYDNIPATLPLRPFIGAERNSLFDLKREIRGILSDKLGANELLTYSFVSKALQEKSNENVDNSYEIVNSISPELQVFRQTIIPSLLEKTHDNLKAGFSDFTLYEMNQVTKKSLGLENDKGEHFSATETEKGTPVMQNHLALVSTGDFYQAKAFLEQLVRELHIEIELTYGPTNSTTNSATATNSAAPAHAATNSAILSPATTNSIEISELSFLEPTRAVLISVKCEDGSLRPIGHLGEIKLSVAKKFKLENATSCFELNLDQLLKFAVRNNKIDLNFSKFPSTTRDLTVKTSAPYGEVKSRILAALAKIPDLIYNLEPVSIYRPTAETEPKTQPEVQTKSTAKSAPETLNEPENSIETSLSFRLTFASREKTLESDEISAIMENVENATKSLNTETK